MVVGFSTTYAISAISLRKFLACPETEKQRKIREKLAKLQAKEEQLKKEDLEKQLIQQGDTRCERCATKISTETIQLPDLSIIAPKFDHWSSKSRRPRHEF
jgi:hypothetical protein